MPRNRLVLVVPMLALAQPLGAITVASSAAAPDPGIAAGESLVIDFDAANAAGIDEISWGGPVLTAAGSIGGVRAAPAGDATAYRSLGAGASTAFDFGGWSHGRGLASLSVHWGSVDRYNFIDFFNFDNQLVATIGGGGLPAPDGDWYSDLSNRRVFARFTPAERVRTAVFRSEGTAFEFDTVGAAAAVPEPGNWAMMIIGFGVAGAVLRRRRAVRPGPTAAESCCTATTAG